MQVFHAGTSSNEAGDIIATGGRVLAVTASSSDVALAQKEAYKVNLQCAFCLPCLLQERHD